MSSLCLVIALILATASAKRVKKETEDDDIGRICYYNNYPYHQCRPTCVEYPVISDLIDSRNPVNVQRILERANALEDLCSEASRFVDCVSNALKRAPKQCLKFYEGQYLWTEQYDSYSSILELICTDDFIEKIRRNLDCVGQADYKFTSKVGDCRFANLSLNCSGIVDHDERWSCYREQHRLICDNDAVVQCGAEIVGNRCGEEVAEMATFVGNAFLQRFPNCPVPSDNGGGFKSLLKFFKI